MREGFGSKIHQRMELHCKVCGNAGDHIIIGKPQKILDPQLKDLILIECPTCRVQRCFPFPRMEDMDIKIYNDEYAKRMLDYSNSLRGGLKKVKRFFRNKRMLHLARNYIPKGETILDVGCGRGDFTLPIHLSGLWKVIGMDVNPTFVAHLRAEGVEAYNAMTIKKLELQKGSIGVVWASHVVEHIGDLEGFINEVRLVLKPGGRVIIKTPSRSAFLKYRKSWLPKVISNPNTEVRPPWHLWSFTKDSLMRFADHYGFDVVDAWDRLVFPECTVVGQARPIGTSNQ